MVHTLMHLTNVSNDELLAGLKTLIGDGNRIIAKTIAYLAEVEERRLHADLACSSMFDFCVRKLGFSESEAFRRLTAARLVRRFPRLLDIIASGRMNLTSVVRLRDLFAEESFDSLVEAAAGKTKTEIELLVAKLAPKPDVAATIRKLPDTSKRSMPAPQLLLEAASAPPASKRTQTPPAQQLQPLSESRYRVQLTAGAALHDKLEHARGLMRHQNPSGDLATIVERALDLLIAQLEKKKLGKTERPQRRRAAAKPPADPGRVTQAARREVTERDGLQCAFVSADGERCPARDLLELDHRHPRALGGTGEAGNLRWLCRARRAHNQRAAELAFGRKYIEERIRLRRSKYNGPATALSETACQTKERLQGALRSLGFRIPEIEKATAALTPDAWNRPIELLLREALRLLT